MGPVNLRAEVEAEEISITRSTPSLRESEELTTAIAKLRGLDRQPQSRGPRTPVRRGVRAGRQAFSVIVSRMFGGGRAHLALVGSDDPLQAGLENLRATARQEAGDPLPAVRRRAGADGAVADFRGVPLQSCPGLACNRRSGRACWMTPTWIASARCSRTWCGETATRFLRWLTHRLDHGAHGPAVWREYMRRSVACRACSRSISSAPPRWPIRRAWPPNKSCHHPFRAI